MKSVESTASRRHLTLARNRPSVSELAVMAASGEVTEMRVGWSMRGRLPCAAIGILSSLLLVGCGSSDGEPTPGLTAGQCPGVPSSAALNAVAPFWNGLYTMSAKVPGGAPDNLEVSVLDATQDAWQEVGQGTWQNADGTYVVQFQPRITDQNKGSEFKVRVRSRLQGCAPSGWADAGSFTPTDPFSDTVWVGNWDAAQLSGALTVNRTDLTGASALTPSAPSIDGAVTHTVSFNADGTLAEDFALSLASAEKSDPFAGCTLNVHYTGTWSWQLRGANMNIILSARVPADHALKGSDCAFPAPGELLLADPKQNASLVLPPSLLTPNVDYSGLLSTPPAPVVLDNSQLPADLAVMLSELSYASATESGSVNGYISPVLGIYDKQ